MVTTRTKFAKASANLEKAENKVGKLQEKMKREAVTESIGGVWFILLLMALIGLEISSLITTNFFETNAGGKIQEGIYTYIMFFCVISINVLLVIPYMIRLSKKDRNKGYLSTGIARGTSRFHSQHQNIFQQLGQEV